MEDGRPESPPRWIEGERVAIEAVRKAFAALAVEESARANGDGVEPPRPTKEERERRLKSAHLPLRSMAYAELVALQSIGREAFGELIGRIAGDPVHRKDLIGFVMSRSFGRLNPESVMHEAYSDLLEKASTAVARTEEEGKKRWPMFHDPGMVVAYLKKICERKVLNKFRAKTPAGRPDPVAPDFLGPGREPPRTASEIVGRQETEKKRQAEKDLLAAAVAETLDGRGLEDRVIFLLAYEHSWKPAKIAELVHGTDPAVDPDTRRRTTARRITRIETLVVECSKEMNRRLVLARQASGQAGDAPPKETSADGDG